MKALFYIMVLVGVQSLCASPSDELLDALVRVESMGVSTAVGDNGHAIGCLQIHKEVVTDVNRVYGTTYSHSDCKNVEISMDICRKYLLHYGGANASDEKYSRIWNGGPRGHLKPQTIGYWRKVRDIMTHKNRLSFAGQKL